MVSGRISFIGAGPGAADLITVRGARRIAEADIVVWAASLVAPECIQEHARPDAELVDSSRLTHEQAVEIYRRAERERLNVARVHSGDPSLWGAVQEQYDACARMALEVEIVPGVAAFSAAAASVGRELTVPEVAQSLVLTRLEGGKTPMPDGEKVREFAKHGTTMALFLSAARTGQLVEELRAGGYDDDTPVLVAYKVTWPDELMLRTTLGELEQTVKQHKLWRHTLFIVGKALTSGGTRSHLYHAGHFHTYRRADPAARRALRAERPSRRAKPAEPEPAEPGPGAVRDSDVAWWAVRDWQATARGAAKVAAHRSAARVDSAQPELFAEQDADAAPAEAPEQRPAPEPEQVPERTAEPAAAQPKQAEPEQPEPEQAEPKQPAAEQAEPEQAAPKRTSPASTGTAKATAKTSTAKTSTGKSAPKRRTTKAAEPKAAKSRSTAKGKRTSDER
ncbi:precorrin-4 C(11)-methyltransferase [Saccharopolyspora sp. CA-218241]|uniref:precorrin-4 C(11)-methyltransferase n=1 Tax=Saccharopolyspora sp. CA-218241 TaxID=3240027 RepID=UPI003D97EDDC